MDSNFIAPPSVFQYRPRMSKPPEEHRVDDPVAAFERLKSAVKQALTVSKPEILRREAEAKEMRKTKRNGSSDSH
jgi:hypothetical protein